MTSVSLCYSRVVVPPDASLEKVEKMLGDCLLRGSVFTILDMEARRLEAKLVAERAENMLQVYKSVKIHFHSPRNV